MTRLRWYFLKNQILLFSSSICTISGALRPLLMRVSRHEEKHHHTSRHRLDPDSHRPTLRQWEYFCFFDPRTRKLISSTLTPPTFGLLSNTSPNPTNPCFMTSLHADMHTRTPLTRGSMSDLRNSIELRDTEYSDENDEIRFESPFLNTSLAWQSVPAHNASNAPLPLTKPEKQRLIIKTVLISVFVLVSSSVTLILILWVSLPPLREEDRAHLHAPRSLEDVKLLSTILGHYNEEHYSRVMIVWVTTFLLYVGRID